MSSYLVLSDVSKALRDVLWDAYKDDALITSVVGSEAAIVFTNPTQTAQDASNRMSLWLYQITENEHLKNQPPQRVQGNNNFTETPLALNLYYLITPFAPSGELDHLLLGKTAQVLYDNAIIQLRNSADNVAEELKITFCRLSLEELTRIWEALREPYRLSVCYQIRVARIESQHVTQKARVVGVSRDYGNIPDEVRR
jgi:Pvc16 N-terminal domain